MKRVALSKAVASSGFCNAAKQRAAPAGRPRSGSYNRRSRSSTATAVGRSGGRRLWSGRPSRPHELRDGLVHQRVVHVLADAAHDRRKPRLGRLRKAAVEPRDKLRVRIEHGSRHWTQIVLASQSRDGREVTLACLGMPPHTGATCVSATFQDGSKVQKRVDRPERPAYRLGGHEAGISTAAPTAAAALERRAGDRYATQCPRPTNFHCIDTLVPGFSHRRGPYRVSETPRRIDAPPQARSWDGRPRCADRPI